MIFKLNENETVELKYSFRSTIYFEQITNNTVEVGKKFTRNDLLILFYSVVIASLQKAKKPIISMLDFMDAIDDYNGGEKCLNEFGYWYADVVAAQYDLIESTMTEKENKEQTKSNQKGKKNQA